MFRWNSVWIGSSYFHISFTLCLCICIFVAVKVFKIHQFRHSQMERWSDVCVFDMILTIFHISYNFMTQFSKTFSCCEFKGSKKIERGRGRSIMDFTFECVFSANHRREFQTISFHNAFNLICADFRLHCSICSFARSLSFNIRTIWSPMS